MNFQRKISILVVCIIVISSIATSAGIFTGAGSGPYEYKSIRNQTVSLYGKGLYKHMSLEVAPQGIAQDIVTLFLGIPLLLVGLYLTKKGLLKGRLLLAGVLGYFFVTYLFYMNMAMYNEMFLAYVVLTSLSFFAITLTVFSLDTKNLHTYFSQKTPTKFAGVFLILNTFAIALLWLQVIVPPLLDGSIYPPGIEHYTTLIVQGMDLSLLLPLALFSGIYIYRKNPLGYVMAPIYTVFLTVLMIALVSKIVAMLLIGINAGPPLVIIPLITLVAATSAILMLRSIDEKAFEASKRNAGLSGKK